MPPAGVLDALAARLPQRAGRDGDPRREARVQRQVALDDGAVVAVELDRHDMPAGAGLLREDQGRLPEAGPAVDDDLAGPGGLVLAELEGHELRRVGPQPDPAVLDERQAQPGRPVDGVRTELPALRRLPDRLEARRGDGQRDVVGAEHPAGEDVEHQAARRVVLEQRPRALEPVSVGEQRVEAGRRELRVEAHAPHAEPRGRVAEP